MLNKKLKLHGFNNLTKTLSCNFYRIGYATRDNQHNDYLRLVDETYNSHRLTQILSEVSEIIGATVLNIATQDYEPRGSSVTMMIAEQDLQGNTPTEKNYEIHSNSVVVHLDKSHITAHTYPETHPHTGISTFRVDIDVSTCGDVSPLRALNHLIHSFNPEIVITDYRIRGFTRDESGGKHYTDHELNSIQEFLIEDIRRHYTMRDVNVYQEKMFHTRMIIKNFRIDDNQFGPNNERLSQQELMDIERCLRQEIEDIYHG